MNETIVQDERYPEWMKTWNAKTAEIDQQIIDYVQGGAEQTSEAMDEIGRKLSDWWDNQHMDDIARAEYQKAKADTKLLKAKVENRVTHLIENGKIKWAKLQDKADKD